MTARISCFKSIAVRPAFLKNSLGRSWPFAVWYSIALFIIMPLAHMMAQSDLVERYSSPEYVLSGNSRAKMLERFASDLEGYYYLTLVTLIAIGIMAGLAAVRYLMSRRSAYFYHSLPISRYELFASSVLSHLATMLIALAINLVLTSIVYSAFGFMTLYGEFLVLVLKALMYAVLFFAITVFAGMLTGQTYAAIAALVYILGILPALYYTVKAIVEHSYTFTTDLIPTAWLRFTSPVVRLLYSEDIPLTVSGVIVTVVATVAVLVGAYFVYRARRSEMSGSPVVFDKLAEVARCLFFFPLVFFTGVVFDAIAGEMWRYIGYVIGALVGTMAANLMLYRNPKLMLRGWKKSIVCFVAFLAVWFTFGMGVISFDRVLPPAGRVEEVEFSIGGETYATDDEELIALALEMTRKNMDAYYEDVNTEIVYTEDLLLKEVPITEYVDSIVYVPWSYYTRITFKTKLGLTNTKGFSINDIDSARKFFSAYLSSGAYVEYMTERLELAAEKHVDYGYVDFGIGYVSDHLDIEESVMRELLAALRLDMTDEDYFESPVIATLTAYAALPDGRGRQYMAFPLRTGDERTMAALKEYTDHAKPMCTVEGLVEAFYEQSSGVAIEVIHGEKTVTYTDKAEIIAILEASTKLTNDYARATLEVGYSDINFGVCLMMNVKGETAQGYDYTFGTSFIKGMVPDFVLEDFGE